MTPARHFLCAVVLRPHDPRVRCTCDPVKLAAAIERERREAEARVVEMRRGA